MLDIDVRVVILANITIAAQGSFDILGGIMYILV